MKKALALFTLILLNTACSGFGANNASIQGQSVTSNPLTPGFSPNDPNVVKITVGCGYINEPCVSVTICNPSTNACKTVDNILLDTGSYGLRVFKSQVDSLNLTSSNSGVAECQQYLDNSSDWGPVVKARVGLGSEFTQQDIPIQIIDANYPETQATQGKAAQDAGCDNADTDPIAAGYNGILGVGLDVEDCGSACTQNADNTMYFTCASDGTCSGTTVSLADQVSNPVASMPTDFNNGIVVNLPSLSAAGAASVTGYMILGIGTTANNLSGSPTVFMTSHGDIMTTFKSHTYPAFLDSGSNGLYFPQTDTGLTTDSYGFYTSASLTTLQATLTSATGTATDDVSFQILNTNVTFAPGSPNIAFNDIGAPLSSAYDWGLPFFFGRTIYVGLEDRASSLNPTGVGSYWAY